MFREPGTDTVEGPSITLRAKTVNELTTSARGRSPIGRDHGSPNRADALCVSARRFIAAERASDISEEAKTAELHVTRAP